MGRKLDEKIQAATAAAQASNPDAKVVVVVVKKKRKSRLFPRRSTVRRGLKDMGVI